MKKILTVLALVAFTSSVFAATGLTNFTSKVSSGLNKLDQKEQELNTKVDNMQAQRAAQKAAAQKKQEEQKKAVEAKKKELEAQKNANKRAVKEEVGFWKSLFGRK